MKSNKVRKNRINLIPAFACFWGTSAKKFISAGETWH